MRSSWQYLFCIHFKGLWDKDGLKPVWVSLQQRPPEGAPPPPHHVCDDSGRLLQWEKNNLLALLDGTCHVVQQADCQQCSLGMAASLRWCSLSAGRGCSLVTEV